MIDKSEEKAIKQEINRIVYFINNHCVSNDLKNYLNLKLEDLLKRLYDN